ncbi:MAG TPA: carboxymuconolactone decarboxylase family protein [Ktedonobacteraceae bacterium]|nr:carboxymuconolactone decarboxylase family protein [Ktedonobacteraceae bacterium]
MPHMSRIPPVGNSENSENGELPLHDMPGVANMGNLFRVMAHRPTLAQQSMQLLETAMRSGTVEPRLKELLAVRVSQVNHCFY